jgi:translation initiation factor IF-2
MEKNESIKQNVAATYFPPVVAVLGHVDHGKTTLLDAIRKTSLADKEYGGITQTIGASSVEIMHEGKPATITFIDTPGHEAFGKMRGRGAQAADMALLIVAANDSVKPQTKESIAILKETNTPFIVVITKIDLPEKNVERVKQDLAKEQVNLENYGGDVPLIEVCAKTNHNIKELLDLIILFFTMHKPEDYEKQIRRDAPLRAIVIESKLDLRAGAKATVVIKNGCIRVREELQIEDQICKIRNIFNSFHQAVQEAGIGEAVEILGFEKVPPVGAILLQKKHASTQITPQKDAPLLQKELHYHRPEKAVGLSILLIADTQGSLEAITYSLPKDIALVMKKTGEVSEADVLLAKSTGSIILSFNTKIKPNVSHLAYTEKILIRNYTIIYELLDELQDALEGKIQSQMEQIFGKMQVLAKFPFEKTFAYGVRVLEGRLARGDHLRILREEQVIGEGTLQSLRVGKSSTSKVEKGQEAGIVFNQSLDIQVGDMILSHS